MRPIKFKYSNVVLQPNPSAQYSDEIEGVDPLHIFTNGEQCISCWHMSWKERLSALLFGRVWLAVLSGASQPPVYVEAARKYLGEAENA